MKPHEREPGKDELAQNQLPSEEEDEPDDLLSPASQIGRAA